jgi:hypothetical protein
VDCLSSSSSSTSRTTGSKSDIWERTFDGFGAFAGTAWKYRIQAYDTRKNRIVTKWQSFNIDARAEVTTTTTTTTILLLLLLLLPLLVVAQQIVARAM